MKHMMKKEKETPKEKKAEKGKEEPTCAMCGKKMPMGMRSAVCQDCKGGHK